ncbi:hypothetical protein JST97_38700 [bacterium]|nr:hypothetical protein [bacterium]
MTRAQLEHVLRAAGAIAQEDKLVIIGSQAILGAYPEAPPALTVSLEVDLYPLNSPNKADLIDGSIGERSPFHETFGYYAHGIGPETALLPYRWLSRVVEINNANTGGVTGLCLHPADLAVSKLLAGRTKDLEFVKTMLSAGLVQKEQIESLQTELTEAQRRLLQSRLP